MINKNFFGLIWFPNIEEIDGECLFFCSCWKPCPHQKPYWTISHRRTIHSSSSVQSQCKRCSCFRTPMSLNTSSSAHRSPQLSSEASRWSSHHLPYLEGRRSQDQGLMCCISSSMEKDPCNVSAQSPPAENTQGNYLFVKYKTPLLEIWLIQHIILSFLNYNYAWF